LRRKAPRGENPSPSKRQCHMLYVNELISEKVIPSWDAALGLYVVGHLDPRGRTA